MGAVDPVGHAGGHVPDALWAAVAQTHADYYVPRWQRYAAGAATFPSWHWPALFASLGWALYRRVWLAAAVYALGVPIALYVVWVVFGLRTPPDTMGLGQAALWVVCCALLAPALFANAFYYRQALELVTQAQAAHAELAAQIAFVQRRGGTTRVLPPTVALLVWIPVVIVASLAVAMHQAYLVRTKVEAVLAEAQRVEARRAQAAPSRSRPDPNVRPELAGPIARYLRAMEQTAPDRLDITFDFPPLEGSRLALIARRTGDHVVWSCQNVDVPSRFVPPDCRRAP